MTKMASLLCPNRIASCSLSQSPFNQPTDQTQGRRVFSPSPGRVTGHSQSQTPRPMAHLLEQQVQLKKSTDMIEKVLEKLQTCCRKWTCSCYTTDPITKVCTLKLGCSHVPFSNHEHRSHRDPCDNPLLKEVILKMAVKYCI